MQAHPGGGCGTACWSSPRCPRPPAVPPRRSSPAQLCSCWPGPGPAPEARRRPGARTACGRRGTGAAAARCAAQRLPAAAHPDSWVRRWGQLGPHGSRRPRRGLMPGGISARLLLLRLLAPRLAPWQWRGAGGARPAAWLGWKRPCCAAAAWKALGAGHTLPCGHSALPTADGECEGWRRAGRWVLAGCAAAPLRSRLQRFPPETGASTAACHTAPAVFYSSY
jgi:hypothetical protein